MQGRELRGHFRWRLHELPLPVAQRTVPPASAANVAVSSSASSFRPRPVVLAVGGRSLARSLARFSDPLFHWKSSSPPFSHLSLSLPLFHPLRSPKTLFAIRRRTPVQRNFVQWRNLAITIARPRTPVIPYRLYFSLSRVSPPPKVPPSVGSRPRVLALHYAYPPAR